MGRTFGDAFIGDVWQQGNLRTTSTRRYPWHRGQLRSRPKPRSARHQWRWGGGRLSGCLAENNHWKSANYWEVKIWQNVTVSTKSLMLRTTATRTRWRTWTTSVLVTPRSLSPTSMAWFHMRLGIYHYSDFTLYVHIYSGHSGSIVPFPGAIWPYLHYFAPYLTEYLITKSATFCAMI